MSDKEQKNTCCNGDNCKESQKPKLKTELNLIQINSAPEPKASCQDDCCSTPEPKASCQDDCCSAESKPKGDESDLSEVTGHKSEFRVHGMDCPACALTIEKSIGQLENIKNVSVNYSTGKMQVVAENPSVLEKLPAEMKKLGYTLEPIESKGNVRIYTIEGMDCSSCALTLENHLKQHPSVKSVSVNFSTGKMRIEHDNSVEEIMKEVEKAGYKASLVSNRRAETEMPTTQSSNNLLVLSGVLLLFGFLGSLTDMSPFMANVLYAISILISGYKPAKSAYYAIKSRSLDMNVLMTAAVIGAAMIGEWLEGATVVWLFALGNALQTKSIEKTRNSIRSLLDLAPPEAWVKQGRDLVRKSVEEVAIGDIIVVKPGDKIPLDGEVVQGESSVNQAPITGESIPVDKQIGDTVYAGTINEHGSLEIKVTKLVEDTTISKIIHLVEEAQEKKAPTQAFVDKFAQIYTPIVFALALAVMIFPPLLGSGTWGDWFYKGLELLVVACPCALVISTPVAIVSAIGNAAKNGVLIKGGAFLETAGSINAIAFDKTGTLTEGKPKVSQVIPINTTKTDLLSIARTLEEYSTHPIALAVVNYAKEKEIPSRNGELFKSIVGKGVQATIEGIEYFAGNLKLFQELNTPIGEYESQMKTLQNEGNTLVIVGTKEQILGIIAVADTIRETTVKALQGLKNMGVDQIVMLTGDNKGTAEKVASQTGVNRYFAELLPEDKVKAIKQLQDEGKRVAMVGDGINDAPALATANLGIAMGGAGTDTAMETADIVLMADNLEKLPYTIKLSRKALKIIKQNIWFSLIIKFVALLLIFPGWLTLWVAVLSDTGAALLVILNSMRLLRLR
ncbi:heavy metal translocating P-type ATPase [Parageobacillus toebii]|uniref:heavy metal translocating P-type ATPase n=1 Tax=Parageobacillus toebii TaxID=153151 RepID=UPI0019679255|nr:heavy metal translocating P-type ATPase [Parageobacillus toebii]QSB48721.1 cadmium-translocating P-type ATPase [Parageobacillus toebii]